MKTLNILFSFAIVLFLSACTTYNESMSYAKYSPIERKLPKMQLVWKNTALESNQSGSYLGSYIRKAIFSEITTNCMEEERDSIVGRIEVDLLGATYVDHAPVAGLTGLTFGVAPLLGVPLDYGTVTADIRISIYDVYDRCFKTYTYYGREKYRLALYNGKTPDVSANNIGKDIAASFKMDLSRDIAKLYPNLQTKVYNSMSTEAGKHIQEAIYHCESSNWKKALKELEQAKYCSDINDNNRELIQSVGAIANTGRQQQIQRRNEMWAAIGVGLTMATLATTASIMASKSKSPSTTNSGTQYVGSSTDDDDADSEMETPTLSNSSRGSVCTHCRGTGDCKTCEGKGFYYNPYDWSKKLLCPNCESNHNGKCAFCHGSGRR